MLEIPSTGTAIVPKSDVKGEGDGSIPLQNEAAKYVRKIRLNKEETLKYEVYESIQGTDKIPNRIFTRDEVKNDDGEITYGGLLHSIFDTYRDSIDPGECRKKKVWTAAAIDDIPERTQMIEIVVIKGLEDNGYGLSHDSTFHKIHKRPCRGPKLPKCSCDECAVEEEELQVHKMPENSADGGMFKLLQEADPVRYGRLGKKVPDREDDKRAAVLEAKEAATQEMIEASVFEVHDRCISTEGFGAILIRARENAAQLKACRVFAELFDAYAERVTRGVVCLQDFYAKYQEAISSHSKTFLYTLGGHKIEWKVHFEIEMIHKHDLIPSEFTGYHKEVCSHEKHGLISFNVGTRGQG